MEEKILLAELTKNCEGKKEKLFELLKAYELAELGRKVNRQEFIDIENKYLAEHEFFAGRPDFKKRYDDQPDFGERITDESWDFLLSDEDFDRLQKEMIPIYVEHGLTDEEGYYITNWDTLVCDARCELVEFIIAEIIPACFRNDFEQVKDSIVWQEKIINIFKDSCKSAA